MKTAPIGETMTLKLEPIVQLSDEQLYELCRRNGDLHIERTARGELVMMTPAGGETSDRNAEITMQLRRWAREDGSGRSFDSSGGFLLGNGAMRAPDASWVEVERLRPLSREQRERFLPLCPTFVIELRSPSDKLFSIQEKMVEYVDNGARLAWLVDPVERRVQVYRPGAEVEILNQPAVVSGDPELPGFMLELDEIWDPSW